MTTVNCAERETSTTRGSTPNTAGPLSGPPDRDVYCKYYFSSKHICFRKVCWFLHVPLDGDEQFCTEVVIRFSRDANQSLLQRAAAVFVSYYQKCPPGIHFDLQALKRLLSTLFKHGIIKDVLSVLRVLASYRILPPSEFILALFDHCVDAGLPFTPADFQHMQWCLEQLGLPAAQMNSFLAFKLRGLGTDAWKASGEVQLATAEVERCREQGDWTRLGTIFSSLCASQHSLADLRQLSGHVTLALLKDSAAASLPFAQFAQAVFQGSSANGLMSNLIGRIGVSLMFRYYGAKQWHKGTQLLDTLKGLDINYSMLSSLFGSESGVSQGRTVSVAVELFLNSGSMESALQVLKDNDWLSGSSPLPCDADTTQIRQAVLCQLADSCIQKGVHRVALEVLSKLPSLKDQADPAAVSQPGELFHRHLSSCLEKQNLTVASETVELMFAKSVSVDMRLLRTLIHKLGKQNVWLKARSLFRCALSMGCYPPTQVNPYCRLLPIPYSLTEVEMAIAIEMFMVSNADEIHGQSQIPLQVVLKRKEGSELVSDGDYNAAGNRLLFAAQIANPKLVIKYATVNPSQEQVFTLDPLSVRKWLTQNMKWATSIWRETGDDPPASDCLSG
ncbi:protein TOPAZ1-like [Brienomyrus brachyistius]|uniref:protein TOPAZ1-like n=1 Tax=Brienomyrus brachyistius TaxID=42636 RepID=UPI0020B25FB5|nr:protein TOPAZ1-like [Brienomyrus brachyistius]